MNPLPYPRLPPAGVAVVSAINAVRTARDAYETAQDAYQTYQYTRDVLERTRSARRSRRTGSLRGTYKPKSVKKFQKKSIILKSMPRTKTQKKNYPRRKFTKKPKNVRRKPTIKKELKLIKRSLKADQAYHTYKDSNCADIDASVAKCQHGAISVASITNLQSAMANFRYYDPSTPGTLVTADASTGTYSRQIHCNSITNSLTLRNNYQVPCRYRVYKVVPKSDTNIAPLTYYTNGITDQVITAGVDQTTPQIYLTDIDVFNSQWSAKVLRSGILQPGQQVSCSYKSKSFDFDPSVFDSHTVDYQPKYGCSVFIVRIEGVVGHDTTADDQTTLQASLDMEASRIYKFTYDAGVNLNDIYIQDSRDQSFTNGGLISNKPVSDNQAYSIT